MHGAAHCRPTACGLLPSCSGRLAAQPLPAAATRPAPRRRRALAVVAAGRGSGGKKGLSEADLYSSVPGGPGAADPAAGQQAQPWFVTAPLAFLGFVAVLRTLGALRRRFAGSNRLEERGYKRDGAADDKLYMRAMKGMKTTAYEELSEEQILAARRRRQVELGRDMAPMDLDNMELPDNHPFAMKKKVSPEEDALQRARLSARRGLSPEDMLLLKQQQELAAKMDEEQEAKEGGKGGSASAAQ